MWNGKLKKTVVQVSTGCEFANNGRRMSAHLHVRTSARLGRKGHKGTVKTDAALPCRGWPVSSGNKNEALLLLHSFPFSTQPLPCQYVFPDMCGAERRLDMLADLDKGRARCPVLAGQQTGITFLFFLCADSSVRSAGKTRVDCNEINRQLFFSKKGPPAPPEAFAKASGCERKSPRKAHAQRKWRAERLVPRASGFRQTQARRVLPSLQA